MTKEERLEQEREFISLIATLTEAEKHDVAEYMRFLLWRATERKREEKEV